MNSLQLRLISFAADVMNLTETVSRWSTFQRIADQLNRSSSSIGANYSEAQSSSSRKDFHNKIRIALKEARETEYWLHLLTRKKIDLAGSAKLIVEIEEIIKILVTISIKTSQSKS